MQYKTLKENVVQALVEDDNIDLDDLNYGITSDETRENVNKYLVKRNGLPLHSGSLLPNARARITDAIYNAVHVIEHYAEQGLFQNPEIERWIKGTFNGEIDRIINWHGSKK